MVEEYLGKETHAHALLDSFEAKFCSLRFKNDHLFNAHFQGVLESPDDFNSSEDVYEAVGSVLLDSSQDPTDEEGIRDLCALLLGALKG